MIGIVSEILFWIFAGLIFYVYFGYPPLLAFLSVLFRRRPIEANYTARAR